MSKTTKKVQPTPAPVRRSLPPQTREHLMLRLLAIRDIPEQGIQRDDYLYIVATAEGEVHSIHLTRNVAPPPGVVVR